MIGERGEKVLKVKNCCGNNNLGSSFHRLSLPFKQCKSDSCETSRSCSKAGAKKIARTDRIQSKMACDEEWSVVGNGDVKLAGLNAGGITEPKVQDGPT